MSGPDESGIGEPRPRGTAAPESRPREPGRTERTGPWRRAARARRDGSEATVIHDPSTTSAAPDGPTGRSLAARGLACLVLLVALAAAVPAHAQAEGPGTRDRPMTIPIVDAAVLGFGGDAPELVDDEGFVIRHETQSVRATVDLPPRLRFSTGRLIATVEVDPIAGADGRPRDRWTRLGQLLVEVPSRRSGGAVREVELIRFVTGYGAGGIFEADVTALAPLLEGRTTFRIFVSTYGGAETWRASARLRLEPLDGGHRRPAFATPLFHDLHVTRLAPVLRAEVTIPGGTMIPRIRVTTTGHASDGEGANEFLTAPHVLRVDGREVARWRPWSEDGVEARAANPWAGRIPLDDGSTIRASDLDRSGWHPGRVVEPLVIPVPELTPGLHVVELEILGIRPRNPEAPTDAPPGTLPYHGYWAVTAEVLGDRPVDEKGD